MQKTDSKANLDGFHILLAEDSIDNQILVTIFLEKAGAEVDTANNGEEAIRKAQSDSYDVILMDLQMPLKNGYDATSDLRSQGYSSPIIALTAHALWSEVQYCLQNGFNAHLSKPIDRIELIKTIREVAQSSPPS